MLLIKTKLGPSKVHGIGLFADQFIPQGTITWKYDPEFDIAFSKKQIHRISQPARERFWEYAYFDKELNKYVLCFDDLRFINHSSKNPNIISTPRKDIATRDIKKGEELLCNYNDYEKDYFKRREIDETRFM